MFSLSTQNPKCDHQQREQKVTENTGPLHVECVPAGVKASSLLEKQLWACSADKSSLGTARLARALSRVSRDSMTLLAVTLNLNQQVKAMNSSSES